VFLSAGRAVIKVAPSYESRSSRKKLLSHWGSRGEPGKRARRLDCSERAPSRRKIAIALRPLARSLAPLRYSDVLFLVTGDCWGTGRKTRHLSRMDLSILSGAAKILTQGTRLSIIFFARSRPR